ncbi:MAG: hypothetical protein J2O48_09415 [Solirubrobacterales bacterium]|nr:hypothetical protein [Solirubrobacterales bacterium]
MRRTTAQTSALIAVLAGCFGAAAVHSNVLKVCLIVVALIALFVAGTALGAIRRGD